MKFAIALAALTIAVQSATAPTVPRYSRYWQVKAPAPAPVHPAPTPVHPAPAPAPVHVVKCNLANEEVGPSGACKCVDGFVRISNICVKPAPIVCTNQFETLNKEGKCDCQSGFERN